MEVSHRRGSRIRQAAKALKSTFSSILKGNQLYFIPSPGLAPEEGYEHKSIVYLRGDRIFVCRRCLMHICTSDDIISEVGEKRTLFRIIYQNTILQSFHGKGGRAFLISHCHNILSRKPKFYYRSSHSARH